MGTIKKRHLAGRWSEKLRTMPHRLGQLSWARRSSLIQRVDGKSPLFAMEFQNPKMGKWVKPRSRIPPTDGSGNAEGASLIANVLHRLHAYCSIRIGYHRVGWNSLSHFGVSGFTMLHENTYEFFRTPSE